MILLGGNGERLGCIRYGRSPARRRFGMREERPAKADQCIEARPSGFSLFLRNGF
jgi:hypothetical protein